MPFTSKLGNNHEGFFRVALFIGSLVADLVKESQEAKVEEAHSRADYERVSEGVRPETHGQGEGGRETQNTEAQA